MGVGRSVAKRNREQEKIIFSKQDTMNEYSSRYKDSRAFDHEKRSSSLPQPRQRHNFTRYSSFIQRKMPKIRL